MLRKHSREPQHRRRLPFTTRATNHPCNPYQLIERNALEARRIRLILASVIKETAMERRRPYRTCLVCWLLMLGPVITGCQFGALTAAERKPSAERLDRLAWSRESARNSYGAPASPPHGRGVNDKDD